MSRKKEILAVIVAAIVVCTAALGFAMIKQQPDQTIGSNEQNNSTQQIHSQPTLISTPTNTPTTTPTPTSTWTLPTSNITAGGIELTMSIEKTVFNFGEPVNVTLTLTNVSQKTVNYVHTAMNFDFIVYNSTNNVVYQYTSGKAFPMIAQVEPLAPGENVTATYVWPQTMNALNDPTLTPYPQVSAGTYFIIGKGIIGVDENQPYHLQTEPTQVTMLNP